MTRSEDRGPSPCRCPANCPSARFHLQFSMLIFVCCGTEVSSCPGRNYHFLAPQTPQRSAWDQSMTNPWRPCRRWILRVGPSSLQKDLTLFCACCCSESRISEATRHSETPGWTSSACCWSPCWGRPLRSCLASRCSITRQFLFRSRCRGHFRFRLGPEASCTRAERGRGSRRQTRRGRSCCCSCHCHQWEEIGA